MRAVGESRTTSIRIALGDGRPLGPDGVTGPDDFAGIVTARLLLGYAGRRVVVVPAMIKPALAHHVAAFTASLPRLARIYHPDRRASAGRQLPPPGVVSCAGQGWPACNPLPRPSPNW
jgi:hypothetical protein